MVIAKKSYYPKQREVVLRNGLEYIILHKEYVNCKIYDKVIQKLIICLAIKGDDNAIAKFYKDGFYYNNKVNQGNIKPPLPHIIIPTQHDVVEEEELESPSSPKSSPSPPIDLSSSKLPPMSPSFGGNLDDDKSIEEEGKYYKFEKQTPSENPKKYIYFSPTA